METTTPIASVESVGIDWLTATAPRARSGESFRELGQHLLERSALWGNDISHWRGQGYIGRRCGGVVAATRNDTHIIKLSSDDARESWREVQREAANVSRIDLQITFKLERPSPGYIAAEHQRALRSKGGRGRKPSVTFITSTTEGDSLYMGRRVSDVYGRCYDKGREEKIAPPGTLIRHELEVKSKRAMFTATHLAATESEAPQVAAIVSSYMERFGLQTVTRCETVPQYARGQTGTMSAKLRWLGSAARPSIERLIEAGMLHDVVRALGLSGHVTINHDAKED